MLFKMLFTPPPTPPPQNRDSERAGASERTRTLELTHAKEEAAKMAAELARVQRGKEKKKHSWKKKRKGYACSSSSATAAATSTAEA